MNMKLVIILTILVVLLVAFGRNPGQEAREQRRKEIDEKGILAYEIEKHLEEKKNQFPGVNTGGGPSRLPPGALPGAGRNAVPPGAIPAEQAPAAPDPVMQPAPTQPQGYYPPPPVQENTVPVFNPTAPRSERNSNEIKRLASDVALDYMGTQVFVKTKDGQQLPLPDGQYLISNDSFLMTVLGGERVDIAAYRQP